jgi:hypothetical protein
MEWPDFKERSTSVDENEATEIEWPDLTDHMRDVKFGMRGAVAIGSAPMFKHQVRRTTEKNAVRTAPAAVSRPTGDDLSRRKFSRNGIS